MTTVTPPRRETYKAAAPDLVARKHRRRRTRADLLAVSIWASVALSATLYLSQGAALHTATEAVTTAGILAGLIGSNLVLVMLVLAARVPLIDRTIGHDRALAVHGRLGKPACILLIGHGLLLTLGYSLADGSSFVAETMTLFSIPDLTLAYVSIGLFVAVIITSLKSARRRLPYEAWHIIHLLSYAAVVTALPHQFSQGGVLSEGTWQRVYWFGLFAVALGALLTFRLVEPLVQSLRHRVRVERVDRIGADAFSIVLAGRHLDRLAAKGGQYIQWRFWTRQTWWHGHPVSLSAVPTDSRARITIRALGAGTRQLVSTLRPGTKVSIAGPYGAFTHEARGKRTMAFAAAGIGVTPIRALLEQLDAGPGEVSVLVRASDPSALYLWDEIEAICRARGWSAWTSLGPRADGASSWLSAADVDRGVTLESIFPNLADSDLFICGADLWAEGLEREARAHGLSASHIQRERFDW